MDHIGGITLRDTNIIENMVMYSDKLNKEKEYWMEKLSGNIDMVEFPSNCNQHNHQYNKMEYEFNFEESIANKIFSISNKSDLGTFIVLLSGVIFVLHKYSGMKEIIVGTPVIKYEDDSKNYNEYIIIKDDINGELSYKEYLLKLKLFVTEAYNNQNAPINKILETLHLPSMDNLIKTVVLLENIHNNDIKNANMAFLFNILEDKIMCTVAYNSNLYNDNYIFKIVDNLRNYFIQITNDHNVKLLDIDIVADDEKKLLRNFNDTTCAYQKEKTLYELFEEQVERTPINIALKFDNMEMTYQELNNKSNQLAKILRKNGVYKGSIVGLMVRRSIDMIISIFGILKAGGIYLPLDPNNPKGRICEIIDDSEIDFLIIERTDEETFEFETNKYYDTTKINILQLDCLISDSIKEDDNNLNNINTSNDPAYIIYTSGSTGKPKGVIIQHYSVTRMIKNTNYIDISPSDVLLQQSNYCFDLSVWEIFGSLLNGSKLVIASEDTVLDMIKLSEFIREENISILFTTTAIFNTLIDINIENLRNTRKILFGAEKASLTHVKKAFQYFGSDMLINLYGPTESTVIATFYPINYIHDEMSAVPIGKPISNTKVYILDKYKKLQPIGVPGEMYISGDGLAKGYLHRPELSEERFIVNPFNNEEKIYKTGDIAKWMPDGNIEFVGREDNQVKIRGFRIELGEIQNLILGIRGIYNAVVIIKEREDISKYICAYIVCDSNIIVADIKKYLENNLPDYMIPHYFIKIDNIPLSSNGKVNSKLLPDPLINEKNIKYIEPKNEIENQILKIWIDVLKLKKIGIDDNYFDLGGQSLNAAILINKINKELKVSISLNTLFGNPTIKELAKYIDNNENIHKLIDDEDAVILKRGSDINKNVFLIHSGSGDVETYLLLCEFLDNTYNYIGIRAEKQHKIFYEDITVEALARKYIRKIKAIQQDGPYNIIGWCFGGTIAYEIVRQLEKNNNQIGKIVLINSVSPEVAKLYDEEDLLVSYKNEIKNILMKCGNLCNDDSIYQIDFNNQPFWGYIKSNDLGYAHIKQFLPDVILDIIPISVINDIKLLYDYIGLISSNMIARDSYIPYNNIQSGLNFIHAKYSQLNELANWDNYCENHVHYFETYGDHFSILKRPHVINLSTIINGILSQDSQVIIS